MTKSRSSHLGLILSGLILTGVILSYSITQPRVIPDDISIDLPDMLPIHHPPSEEEINAAIGTLATAIAYFTSRDNLVFKRHRGCPGRAAWGIGFTRNGKFREVLHAEWDSQHGEFEIYPPNPSGYHSGSIGWINRGFVKKAVKGRKRACACKF